MARKSNKQLEQEQLNAKRLKAVEPTFTTSLNFNLNKYKESNAPNVEHARRWRAMKPYHLVIKEQEEIRKAAIEAKNKAKNENKNE